MGIASTHALAEQQRVVVQPLLSGETYPEVTKPSTQNTGAEAPKELEVVSCGISYSQPSEFRESANSTRSRVDRIRRPKEVSFEVVSEIMPPGGSTEPDVGPLMHSGTGARATGDPVTYSLSDTQGAQIPLSIYQQWADVFQHCCWGAVVNEIVTTVSQGDTPKMTFRGPASGYGWAGNNTIASGGATSATQTVADGGAQEFGAGGVVKVGAEDGANNDGLEISSVDTALHTLALDASITTTGGEAVVPFLEAIGARTDSPASGLEGSVNLNFTEANFDETDFPILELEITQANAVAGQYKAFKDAVQDMTASRRTVTGTMKVLMTNTRAFMVGVRNNYTQPSVIVLIGDATNGLTITMGAVEFDFSDLEIPDEGPAVIALPFTALSTSRTAMDEIKYEWS